MNALIDSTLQITRKISAAQDRVYSAWTDAAMAKQWWGPDGTTTDQDSNRASRTQ